MPCSLDLEAQGEHLHRHLGVADPSRDSLKTVLMKRSHHYPGLGSGPYRKRGARCVHAANVGQDGSFGVCEFSFLRSLWRV